MFTEVLFVYMYFVTKISFSFKNLGKGNVSRKMNTFFWHPKKSAKLSRGIHEGTLPNLTQVITVDLIVLLSSLTSQASLMCVAVILKLRLPPSLHKGFATCTTYLL